MLRATAVSVLAAFAILAAPAAAQIPPLPPLPTPTVPPIPPVLEQGPDPQPYQANDGRGFRDVLPSGTRGLYNGADLAAFLATGRTAPALLRPARDVLGPALRDAGPEGGRRLRYFKDSSFGVRPDDVERTLLPARRRHDRARQGLRRPARLRPRPRRRDVRARLRRRRGSPLLHGRAAPRRPRRSSRASPAGANTAHGRRAVGGRAVHRGRPRAPDRAARRRFYGDRAATMRQRRRATTSPASTATSPRRSSTRPRCRASTRRSPARRAPSRGSATDLDRDGVARRRDLRQGRRRASSRWTQIAPRARRALRQRKRAPSSGATSAAAEDPEAPTTVLGKKRFPYQAPPRKLARGQPRDPRPRLAARLPVVVGAERGAPAERGRKRAARRAAARSRRPRRTRCSSARASRRAASRWWCSGRRSPTSRRRSSWSRTSTPAAPGSRGSTPAAPSFLGLNLYVQLGRGRDYAWSATSAGQDLIDTFALELCQDDAPLPLPRALRADGGARAHERVAAVRRATRPPPASQTLRALAHEARPRGGARDRRRQAGRPHAPALDLLPRDRLRRRLLALQRPRQDPQRRRLPARRERHRLHVQLVLRRRQAHRLLQLGRQPGARRRASTRTSRSGASRVRVARLRPRPQHLAADAVRPAPAGDQPEVPRLVEQQAGEGLPRRRLEHVRSAYRSLLLDDRIEAR